MKRVSQNFIALFMSDAVGRILGFIAIVYIARLLTVEGFGLVSYGMAFLTYALLLGNPGLTTIGAREIAKDRNNYRVTEEILGLRFSLASIIFVVFIIGLLVIPGQSLTKQVIFFYLLSLFPFALLLEFVFQGREEMGYIGASRLIQYGIYVILLFVLVRGSHNILMVPTSFFIGYTASALFLIIIFFKKYKLIRLRFSWSFWRHLLFISTPVGLATIFNQVSLNLPPLVLGIVHSKTEVGFFSAGFKVISMLLIIERVFHFVFFPIITKQHTTTPEKLSKSFTYLTKFLFAMTVPVAFGGLVLAPSIIQFIFGAGYEGTITLFRILLLYFVITPINTIFGYGLVAMDQERRFFKVISITAFINLVLIVALGISFKGAGAAAALFVSEVIGITLMNRELRKLVSFRSMTYLVKPILASCVMMIVLYILQYWHILLLVTLGLLIYIPIFYVMRGFTKEELIRFKLAAMGK